MAEDWAGAATIGGLAIPSEPDMVRLRADRHAKIQAQLESQGIDALVLLGSGNVAYATGADSPGEDSSRAGLFRPVAIVVRGENRPHLYTAYWDGVPTELPADHVHGPLFPDLDDGITHFADALHRHVGLGARDRGRRADPPDVAGPRRLRMDRCQQRAGSRQNHQDPRRDLRHPRLAAPHRTGHGECARRVRPGLRQTDLSGIFLRRIFELGATADAIDPIWQVMGPTRADGPWTIHGDLAFPTSTTDRILREGDVIWVDAGICHQGYASDFGRTWLTSARPEPTERQATHFQRWLAVVAAARDILKPGVSALELGQAAIAANNGVKPWMEHFYLAHGIGTDSAEMPLIGTDLGDDFDASLIMSPGMVLVFEPVIWDDGFAGYRSEDVVAVTDTGWVQLSGHRYDPFAVTP